ncbi:MAG TPA: GNAT family N-acetyltransferase [Croceibacterium sp.]|nr:GNAT family N-acetyltransferase [Croceibacterium sp.]
MTDGMNAPLLVTERLELSLPHKDDVWAMHAIASHPETGRFLGSSSDRTDHFMRFSRSAGSWLLYGYGSFMVRERGSDELIGSCGVFHTYRGLGVDFDDKPEAGWILRHDRGGRGLASEAMTAVLAWFEQEHGSQPIVCLIAEGNGASLALAGKLGFTPMRSAMMPDREAARLLERKPGR